jgi:DNA mismatch endonuclease (patch repair protein)
VTDVVDAATRSRMMAGIKGKNTTPELFLRRALHAQGFRYRLGGYGLPGKPDLVFPGRRVVIFVHGCFWHRHECKYFKWPGTNTQFWREKLEGNVERDLRVIAHLQSNGWIVLTVWECELRESQYTLPNAAVTAVALKLAAINRSALRADGDQIGRKGQKGF